MIPVRDRHNLERVATHDHVFKKLKTNFTLMNYPIIFEIMILWTINYSVLSKESLLQVPR